MSVRKSKDDAGAHRVAPGILTTLRPSVFVQFLYGMVECWLFSRQNLRLVLAIPFLLLTGAGAFGAFWVKYADNFSLIQRYENRFNEAIRADDRELQETCLRALAGLDPGNYSYQFRVGLFLTASGKVGEGYQLIESIANAGELGFAEARMWLVRQSLSPNPVRRLAGAEIEEHLVRILESTPEDADARRLLGEYYLSQNELTLAEKHLGLAALKFPELNLILAQLKKTQNRPGEDTQDVADRAVRELSRKLEDNRADVTNRIYLHRAWLLANDRGNAEEILRSGLAAGEDGNPVSDADRKRLKVALAAFLVDDSVRLLQANDLNADRVASRIAEAILLDASQPGIVAVAMGLSSRNLRIKPEVLKPCIDHWQTVVDSAEKEAEPTPFGDAEIVLCQLLILTGQMDQAAEVMRVIAEKDPRRRLSLTRLLLDSGNTSEGESILTEIVAENYALLDADAENATALFDICNALLQLKRPMEVRRLLEERVADIPEQPTDREKTMQRYYSSACLMEFDQLTGYSVQAFSRIRDRAELEFGPATADELIPLLENAVVGSGLGVGAVIRLSHLSLSPHPAAAAAENVIVGLRLTGAEGLQALRTLGTHALLLREYDMAKVWLEQANTISGFSDAMILNNLAMCLVRSPTPDLEKALELVSSGLSRTPGNGDLLATRGEIYVRQENWDESLRDLVRAVQSRGDNPEIHRLLQETYRALRDDQMSRTHGQIAEKLEFEQTQRQE